MKGKQGLQFSHRVTLDDMSYVVLFLFIYCHVLEAFSLLTYKYDLTLLRGFIYLCETMLFTYCIYSNRKMGTKRLGELLLFMIVGIVSNWKVNSMFLDIFMLALTARRDSKKTINVFYYSLVCSVLTIICIDALGIMPQYIAYRSDGMRRYSFGFSHPNYLGFIIVELVAILLLKSDGRHSVRNIVLIILAAIFCYYVPNSLTSTLILLMIGSVLIMQRFYKFIFKSEIVRNKLVQKLLIIALPCAILIIYYFIFNMRQTFAFDINSTIWSRITQSRTALERYGISMWGQQLNLVSSMAVYFGRASSGSTFAIDSLFVYLPVRYGIVPSIYFAYQYIKTIYLYIMKNNSTAVMICLIMIIYSMIEVVVLDVMFSFIFICAYASEYTMEVQSENFEISRKKIVNTTALRHEGDFKWEK